MNTLGKITNKTMYNQNIVSKTHICFYVAILYRFVIIAQFEGDQDTGVANSEYTKDTLN